MGSNKIRKHPPVPNLAHSVNSKKLNRGNSVQTDHFEVNVIFP